MSKAERIAGKVSGGKPRLSSSLPVQAEADGMSVRCWGHGGDQEPALVKLPCCCPEDCSFSPLWRVSRPQTARCTQTC